jgi:hypothetical protein
MFTGRKLEGPACVITNETYRIYMAVTGTSNLDSFVYLPKRVKLCDCFFFYAVTCTDLVVNKQSSPVTLYVLVSDTVQPE